MRWNETTEACAPVVFSSRIRLARNLKAIPFPERLDETAAGQVASQVSDAVKQVVHDTKWHELPMASIDPLHRLALVERHIISREMMDETHQPTLLIRDDERLGVLVNEEDHLRIQALSPGLNLEAAFQEAHELADRIETVLPIAVSARYGYLTGCPTNVGTGMRASVMVHLPALARANMIGKLLQTLARSGFTLRGFQGEGSRSDGDLYQISNQVTLGSTETQILHDLTGIVEEVVKSERASRQTFYAAEPTQVQDRVGRAYGILRYAAKVSHSEAMMHLSALREGVELGILPGPDICSINELLLLIGPASVQWRAGETLDADERDAARAAFIQLFLKEKEN